LLLTAVAQEIFLYVRVPLHRIQNADGSLRLDNPLRQLAHDLPVAVVGHNDGHRGSLNDLHHGGPASALR
jgi:hypothetical protein